jgi:HTH-type transcriptional regulator/antitoxin HigA
MNWKVIKTEKDHKKAVKRAMEIFHAEPNTPEDDELSVLLVLIKDYELFMETQPNLSNKMS